MENKRRTRHVLDEAGRMVAFVHPDDVTDLERRLAESEAKCAFMQETMSLAGNQGRELLLQLKEAEQKLAKAEELKALYKEHFENLCAETQKAHLQVTKDSTGEPNGR